MVFFFLGTCIAISLSARSSSGKPKLVVLVCLITIFICFTWNTINMMAFYMNDIWYSYVKDLIVEDTTSDLELIEDIIEFFSRMELPYDYMQPWPPTIILLLSDFIVTWRAWALFPHNKIWRSLLLTMMVGNTFINILDCSFHNLISDDSRIDTAIGTFAVFNDPKLDWISVVLSFAVNFLATLSIIWKAWHHHRFLAEASIRKKNTGSKDTTSSD